MDTIDVIELVLPFKAEYVSIARLTASGVATRVGFDLETIEDIKVAIAEVCNKLVKTGSQAECTYKIIFQIKQSSMDIVFDCENKSIKCIFGEEDEELGVSIITALMDKVEFCSQNNYIISMSKELEGNN